MKLKKVLFSVGAAAAICSAALVGGCGGNDLRGIESVERTYSGTTSTYIINFTDGTKYTFDVPDGKDAQPFDVEDAYAACLTRYPTATFEQFLASIVSINPDGNAGVIAKCLCSSLKICAEFTEKFYNTTRPGAKNYGSAVIYSMSGEDTYIITNFHVVYDSLAVTEDKMPDKITCYLYGSGDLADDSAAAQYAIGCTFVGGCASADLAVVKAKTSDVLAINPDAKAITFAEDYTVGQRAIAIGNTENYGISVTEGIVSVENEDISLSVGGKTSSYRSIRIDAAIYEGNSGGGLFDVNGKLIGITNAGDKTAQNVNYAIPVQIVKPVVEGIIHYSDGKTRRLYLGINVESKNARYSYDETLSRGKIVEEVYVTNVVRDSTAQALGLKVGQRLDALVVNGYEYKLERNFTLPDALYSVREGDRIQIKYTQNGTQTSTAEYAVKASDVITVE